MPQRYAVLIGVNQYRHHPQGAGVPLRGPTNDVADWYALLRRLDMRDGHVRILTSPDLTAIELGSSAVSCGVADTASVDAALDWLAGQLAAAGDDALGFVFFAGHGDLRARAGSALYLSDYAGAAPRAGGPVVADGALDLEALRARIDAAAPNATLVAVVDACRGDARIGALGGPVQGIEAGWSTGRHVLLTAASIGQSSYERCLDGRWRGQLTWAATTLLDQWSTHRDTNRYVGLSFKTLAERAGRLIAAISADDQPQTPGVFASPAGLATAVLHVVGDDPGVTDAGPVDAPGHEWGPGTNGVIENSAGILVGVFQVLADSSTKWWWKDGMPPTQTTLTFKSANPLPSTAGAVAYTSPPAPFQKTSWPAPATVLWSANGRISLGLYAQGSANQTWLLFSQFALATGNPPPLPLPLTLSTANQPGEPGAGETLWNARDALSPVL